MKIMEHVIKPKKQKERKEEEGKLRLSLKCEVNFDLRSSIRYPECINILISIICISFTPKKKKID
jgi:hypothetical protein